jgi:hypothetical protein
MFGVKGCVATLLAVSPDAVAITFTVRFDATRNGALYRIELLVGVLPSIV